MGEDGAATVNDETDAVGGGFDVFQPRDKTRQRNVEAGHADHGTARTPGQAVGQHQMAAAGVGVGRRHSRRLCPDGELPPRPGRRVEAGRKLDRRIRQQHSQAFGLSHEHQIGAGGLGQHA